MHWCPSCPAESDLGEAEETIRSAELLEAELQRGIQNAESWTPHNTSWSVFRWDRILILVVSWDHRKMQFGKDLRKSLGQTAGQCSQFLLDAELL